MPEAHPLDRLIDSVHPTDAFATRVKSRVLQRIEPSLLRRVARTVQPDLLTRVRLKDRIFQRIGGDGADVLTAVRDRVLVSQDSWLRLRQRILTRLIPRRSSLLQRGIKWTAALAVFVMILTSMPLVLLTPPLQAETAVQIIPNGAVTLTIGGVDVPLSHPQVLKGPALIRTGSAQATIIFHNDSVFRLAPQTAVRIHDLSDRSLARSDLPTLTLQRGTLWALGLLPPVLSGVRIQTAFGTVTLHDGSVSLRANRTQLSVAVLDRGASFRQGKQEVLLTAGEKAIATDHSPVAIRIVGPAERLVSWVAINLAQDRAHRREMLASEQELRARRAGILPTSYLYPAKRIAERLDVALTFNEQAKAAKLVNQADTRLSEAIALLQQGDPSAASGPLVEYRQNVLMLASGSGGDNLVRSLLEKQLADANASVSAATPDTDTQLFALKQAVLDISSALPEGDLRPKDVEGYVLVDKITALNQTLVATQNADSAVAAYAEIQPYLQPLLAEDAGVHPLLRKEAKSLLVTTASLLHSLPEQNPKNPLLASMETDIAQYLPLEPEKILVTEEERDTRVKAIVARIFLFSQHQSRVNQLIAEMRDLEPSPDRGPMLRRLLHALPPRSSFVPLVQAEIRKLGDELQGK